MAQASSFGHRRPQRPDGMGRGAMMALLIHVGLLIALAFGVSWRSSEPTGSSAELWAAVPQVAAPAAVAPPPPPPMPKVEPKPEPKVEPPPPQPKPDTREADIALEKRAAEKEKREEQEREKLEQLKAEKLEREKQARLEREKEAKLEREKLEKEKREAAAQAAADAERTAKLREDNLKRMNAMAGATGGPQSTGTAQRNADPSGNYGGKIKARVQPNIVMTDSLPSTLRAEVEVRAAPDGTITGRRIVKSSGNSGWDEAVLRAIDRTGDLPKDDNGKVPPSIVIGFTP